LTQPEADKAASDILARVMDAPAAQNLARRVEDGGDLFLSSVAGPAQPFVTALLKRLFPGRAVVAITENLKSQEVFEQDLSTWIGLDAAPGGKARKPLFFPSWEILPHDSRLPHADVISDRLSTLAALLSAPRDGAPAPVVVTSVQAAQQRTFHPEDLRGRLRWVRRGERHDPLGLVEWLEEQGYEPEAQVNHKGELALRGGILDVFPVASPWPIRLEFFGDELESLRYFDPLTQISREEIDRLELSPAGELGILKALVAKSGATGPTRGLGSLLDYLPPGAIVVQCEPASLKARADEYASQSPVGDLFCFPWEEFSRQAVERAGAVVNLSDTAGGAAEPSEGARTFLSAGRGDCQAEVSAVIRETGALTESFLDERSIPSRADKNVRAPALAFQSMDAFRPVVDRAAEPHIAEAQRREFFDQMHRWRRQGFDVRVFCNNEGERQRFLEIWREHDLETPLAPASMLGALARGFVSVEARLAVITDAEIFGRYKVQRPRRLKSAHAQTTRSALDIDFADLDDGDYVVHLQHGIGRYLGLSTLPAGAGGRASGEAEPAADGPECLVIEYAPSDPLQPPPRLYVPVTEAHLVSKYVGTGKARPPLNVLGGTRWAKAKAQAERAVRDVARELLAIQAARESQAGHSFPADSTWQHEFESSFIFEETPDQFRAIEQTKADMERPKPMDRLICGDVGFGKTEVGIRAAFKAVMGGRQAAVLVPTTVLAQQHFNTFRERMADYPVRIELLSRFRSRREQAKVVQDLGSGAVDIVIGTHRLLQGDIRFKDIGLVIIDEEQRFGVLHKEKFKKLRRLVDVLTLSATPIPRTLYLALTGARDMSTIQTPPHDRLPVETIVAQYDERTIRDAIQREMNRGGQVFFLHNRVSTIGVVAQKLAMLAPRARIVVGHGQMHGDELEEVMTTFVNGEADVLLSTTIIESGLDIPNANTIIIDRADRFGLSDLYQLRGRVGRYKHQAYAYLLLPRHATLLSDARKRISALKQYSTLGSGFKIAMRDLEIRGAGNLLGAEQSGHITAVGFELYCQLLKQSVASLKGEKMPQRIETQVRLDFLPLTGGESGAADAPVTASIPIRYMPEAPHRIEIYRKLAQAVDKTALSALEKELRDRFGPLPKAVEWLLQVGELKALAAERGITIVEVKEDKVMLTRGEDYIMAGARFPRLTRKQTGARLKEIKKLLLLLQPLAA
jgi:transcription-repair coupling factor (superfamily II helicase)